MLPGLIHWLPRKLIGNKVADTAAALTDQVSAATINNLAMMLDQIDVHPNGK